MTTSPPTTGGLNLRVNAGLLDSIFDLAARHELSGNKAANMLLEIGYQYVMSEHKGSLHRGMAAVEDMIAAMYGDQQTVDSPPQRE